MRKTNKKNMMAELLSKNQGFYGLIMTAQSSWIILDPPCWVFMSVTVPPESFQSSMVFIEVNAWLFFFFFFFFFPFISSQIQQLQHK